MLENCIEFVVKKNGHQLAGYAIITVVEVHLLSSEIFIPHTSFNSILLVCLGLEFLLLTIMILSANENITFPLTITVTINKIL